MIRVKEESEIASLRLNIKRTKIMASGPIIVGQRKGEKGGRSDRFPLLGLEITANSDCSHEIRIYLLLGRKAMTNLNSVLKSRDISLPTKVHIIKAMVFPVVTL